MLRTRIAAALLLTLAISAGVLLALILSDRDSPPRPATRERLNLAAESPGASERTSPQPNSSGSPVTPVTTAQDTAPAAPVHLTPVIAQADLPTTIGKDLRAVIGLFRVALVGTVVSTEVVEKPYDDPGLLGGLVYTFAVIDVEQWISRPIAGHEKRLTLRQFGGVKPDGSGFVLAEDPIIQRGQRFLFLMEGPYTGNPDTPNRSFFSDLAFSRFLIEGSVLKPWGEELTWLGVNKEMSGLARAQAIQKVRAELQRANIPTAP